MNEESASDGASRRLATIAALEASFDDLLATVDALPVAQLSAGGAVGVWSVRDLLWHVSTWEGEFLKALPVILAGERLPHYSTLYGGIDGFNAQAIAAADGLSPAEVRAALSGTHAKLLQTLRELPDQPSAVEARLRRRLRQDTTKHYAEHAAQLRALASA